MTWLNVCTIFGTICFIAALVIDNVNEYEKKITSIERHVHTYQDPISSRNNKSIREDFINKE